MNIGQGQELPGVLSMLCAQMYSLVNQRDNRIAIETARGIRQIAESQQHDNAIMRTMAEDSNEITSSLVAIARTCALLRLSP